MNSRTPTRLAPQASAFDLAWQPSRLDHFTRGLQEPSPSQSPACAGDTRPTSCITRTFTRGELSAWIEKKSRDTKTLLWYRIVERILWETTGGVISHVMLDKLIDVILNRYESHESIHKCCTYIRNFLIYLSDIRFDPLFSQYARYLKTPPRGYKTELHQL